MRILIIEDERNLSRFLELELRHEGYETYVQDDGKKGLEVALELDWDLILLDLMLPQLNGMEVCRRLRQEKRTPIIMMTARNTTMDLVMGLDQGADDYIFKPFAIEELLARIRSVLRRIDYDYEDYEIAKEQDQSNTILQNGSLTMNVVTREVKKDGSPLLLTRREYELLEYFLRHKGETLTRSQILEDLWGNDETNNIVDVYVRYLRNKLDNGETKKNSFISTVRGVGYCMKVREDVIIENED